MEIMVLLTQKRSVYFSVHCYWTV